jgi:hypothetical protein
MTSRANYEDKAYFQFRDSVKNKKFTLSDLDQFSLYTGIHNFARKKFIIDQFEKTIDVTGNIFEFGTWKGATLILLASWYRMLRPQGNKVVNCFDTFQGLSIGVIEDGNAYKSHEGEYDSDFEILDNIVKAKGLEDYVNFITGDACVTVKEYFDNAPLKAVSFALLDMDLYAPTKNAIDFILPNLSPGGVVIFDEGTSPEWEGEQRALNYLLELADKKGIRYSCEENNYTRQPTTVFTRIR